ncbi:MAG: SCO family protein [Pseudomonadota bacterium]
MRQTAIRVSQSYVMSQRQRARLAKASNVFGHAQPDPDALGGHFDFATWNGLAVTAADFRDHWSLLYFGYARCKGSCLAVAPNIAAAAKALRQRGVAAKAVFVDLEPPPPGMIRLASGHHGHGQHGSNWPQRYAMARLALSSGGKLDVLTGNRFQLSKATAAFHVLREHVPPRPGEENFSINHGSMIYLIGHDTLVAGYGYHDMPVATMVDLVTRLSKADRHSVDLAAVRRRFMRGSCGEDAEMAASMAHAHGVG